MNRDEQLDAKRAADAQIRGLLSKAINGCAELLLPLTGEERRRVLKALRKQGLL